jgi:hypothetical protein
LATVRAVALWVGLGLAALFVLHALVVTSLLWTGGLGWLLERSTGVLKVQAGRSFSLWPGVVQLRQLHLEVTDSNVHLSLDVPSGRANVALSELLRRRFVTRSVTGEHLVLRLKPLFRALTEERRAALPPLSEPKPSTQQSEPTYLWPIRIAGLAATFDELWVSELRYLGDARIEGGFELVPLQHVSVDPTEVGLSGGTLHYGAEQRVLEVRQLAFAATLPETSVEELKQAWRERTEVRLDLTGRVLDLAFAGNLLPELGALSGGQGELSVRAAAERGRWVGPFELDYATGHVGYDLDGLRGSTAIALAAHAPASPEGPGSASMLPAELSVRELSIQREQSQLVRLQEARLALQLTRDFPFAMPRSVRLTLDDLRLSQLDQLPRSLAPASWSPRAARVPRAHAELDWGKGALEGGAELSFADVSFGLGDWSVRQSGQLSLDGLRWPGPGFKLRLSVLRLDLDPLSLQHAETKIDSWQLKLQLADVALAPRERRLVADVVVRGDDARPALSLLGLHNLPRGADNFLAMADLRVFGHVELAPEWQSLSIARAESKTIDVRGRFVRRNANSHAALLFKAAPLSLGVAVKPSDTSFKLFAGDAWLDTQLSALAVAVPEEVSPPESAR